MIKHAREQFFLSANELVDSLSKNNSKSYWSLIRKLMKGNGDGYTIPSLLDPVTNVLLHEDKAKANLLNNYFCSISTIDDSNHDPPDLPLRTDSLLQNIVISEQDIKDILLNLQTGKACGDDIISHEMLKSTAETICKPLSILFNYSLRMCKFPCTWKIARVMPLFKKDDKSIPSNYRPISLLSCIGKVMERAVYKYVYNYIFEHSLLCSHQSGFLRGHSTVFQLLEMYHQICKNLDDRCPTILIFCDISKAFDRVWHAGLVSKLRSYGVSGDLLSWVIDYISNRKQYVFINSECSERKLIKAGVPQGSVLGPLLFLLYINDITDNLDSLARLFADDTSLAYSGPNYDTMEIEINSDLRRLKEWSDNWLVNFNPQKTKALVISNTEIPDLDITFDNESVEIVNNHKHLGLTLSSDGTWTSHIDIICKSAYKQINVLRKLKFTLSKKALSNIYLTFIRPVLEYACEVWDGCFQRDSDKLENIQLEAARIVTGLTKFSSKDSLYFETGWESLADRRKKQKLTVFYKMHNKLCPPYLYNCLPPLTSDVNQYNLRNRENYVVPRFRLRTMERSFLPSSVSLWNNLDPSIRNSPTIASFKRQIKTDIVKAPLYYGTGTRKLSILHTRLRHQCSSLNADLARIHVVNNPMCSCGSPYEDAIHYFMECPKYQNERTNLYSKLVNIDINIETLLFGNDDYSDNQNSAIFEDVRVYIRQTKRF